MTREQIRDIAEDPKAFLERGFRLDARIAAKRERIARWREHAESIVVSLKHDAGIRGGNHIQRSIENTVEDIMILEAEIAAEIKELLQIERDVRRAIYVFVEDFHQQMVLEMRYLGQCQLDEIARKLGFSYRWTQRIYAKAIAEMQKTAYNIAIT